MEQRKVVLRELVYGSKALGQVHVQWAWKGQSGVKIPYQRLLSHRQSHKDDMIVPKALLCRWFGRDPLVKNGEVAPLARDKDDVPLHILELLLLAKMPDVLLTPLLLILVRCQHSQ